MLECVVNISEGRDPGLLAAMASVVRPLDVHRDEHHHRAVVTLAGDSAFDQACKLTRWAVTALDLTKHAGVHPRIGVVDVVPFVDLTAPWSPWTDDSLAARDRFAAWAAQELELPCFYYGPERTLPDVRRDAWGPLRPDQGPAHPHLTAGACAVGARGVLVAYNVWVSDLDTAKRVAADIRRPGLRTLGLAVGDRYQVSCNLITPELLGPDAVYDLVASRAAVAGTELVGLVPAALLERIPAQRWGELDLTPERTIESRLGITPTGQS